MQVMKSRYLCVCVCVYIYIYIYIYLYRKNTILNLMLFISAKNTPFDVDQIHLICSFLHISISTMDFKISRYVIHC